MSRTGSSPKRLGDSGLHEFNDPLHGNIGIIRRHEVEVTVALRSGEIGQQALVDTVRGRDDPALSGLAEDFGQSHHGHSAGSNDIGEHLAGPTEGSWSISPTISRAA